MLCHSLQRRRERIQAVYMYKIATGLVPNNLNLAFYETSRNGLKCHCPSMTGLTPSHYRTVLQNFFSFTGPTIYNKLPAQVKKAETLDAFKRQLDGYLRKIPDLPPTPGYVTINDNSLLAWATGNHTYAN